MKKVNTEQFKTALVTGGAGFIGSHLTKELLNEGLQVIVLDNLLTGKKENVPAEAELIVGDILDQNLVESIFKNKIDVVFHQAAIVTIRASLENFFDDAMINIMGTLNILKASLEHGSKKFIFASSMAVYNERIEKKPIEESYKTQPISPYGISKLTSERYLSCLSQSNKLDIVCLRYFNTYGENQSYTPYVGVITIFVKRLLKGEPPFIFGTGEQIRDFIYVGDVVRANILAMKSDIHFDILNIGTGIGTSVNEIASMLCNKINPNITPIYKNAVPGELNYSVADIARAKHVLGFEPQSLLNEFIDNVIRQYK